MSALDGPPILANCSAAFLDFGANRGLKTQQLLNGDPSSFLRFFPADDRRAVCALGAEPNPSHRPTLRAIEERQRAAGRRVTILDVAIASENGEATFWSDQDYQAHEWGASLLKWQREMEPKHSSRVRTVSLDWLLRRHVLPAAPRFVVAKLDVEGAEYEAVPPALESLCRSVDVLLLEMHARFFKEKWRGHRPGFSTNLTLVEHLIGLLKGLPKRRRAGSCRTQVKPLGTVEQENAHLAERPARRSSAAVRAHYDIWSKRTREQQGGSIRGRQNVRL